jgi:hypothetical protein
MNMLDNESAFRAAGAAAAAVAVLDHRATDSEINAASWIFCRGAVSGDGHTKAWAEFLQVAVANAFFARHPRHHFGAGHDGRLKAGACRDAGQDVSHQVEIATSSQSSDWRRVFVVFGARPNAFVVNHLHQFDGARVVSRDPSRV